MIDSLLARAEQLIQLQRYPEAEKELKQVLSIEPNLPQALALMAVCCSAQNKSDEALHLVQQAISKEPDNDFFLYLHAYFLYRQDKLTESERLIRSALVFEPHNAEYFGLLASIKVNQREWKEGLENANKGLSIDPDNLTCLNARSTTLFKLDKKEEAYSTIQEALSKDPENEVSHTNLGWALLEKGDHNKALGHFREALRINPDFKYAKAGLVEGLKARYWFYRMFLKYAFWVGNMKAKGQWILILGLYFGVRILRGVAAQNETLALFITPVIYLYFAFALSTWIMTPLSNLFLRLNVYGRYALTEDETRSSDFVGISLAIGIFGGVMVFFSDDFLYLMVLFYGFSLMVPLASMFSPAKEKSRRILISYTIGLALIGIAAIVMQAMTNDMGALGLIYIAGVVVYQLVANAMIIR